MNNFLKTLIKPDWDDNPKRSEVLLAANLLQVGEFQLIQLAYKVWFKKELPEDKISNIFSEYMITGIIPIWVTYYAKDIIKLENAKKLDSEQEKYHIYDHEFGNKILDDKKRKLKGIQYSLIIAFIFFFSHYIAIKDTKESNMQNILFPYIQKDKK
ncbi:MAG: hypothetical protein CMI75_06805 [Candidatus Pelagibacter sp.]|nr:hypothetical protein [Candidatus Pelagibacter sp.]